MGPQLETRSQRSAIPRWSGCLDTEPLRQGKVTPGDGASARRRAAY